MVVKHGSMVAAILALAASSPALAKDYIIKFKDVELLKAATAHKSIEGLPLLDSHEAGQLAKVTLDDKSPLAAKTLTALMARDDVAYVVESFQLQMLGVPNDPNYSQQWALPKVNAPRAWERGVGSRSVVVAVIDTGVDWSHPDLAANIWTNTSEVAGNGRDDDGNGQVDDVRGWDFLGNDANPTDETSSQNPGHGTHCSGIVGAVGNNGIGVSGMSQQVSIMPLRFIGPNGQGDLMAAIKSIDYAVAKHADVISASWGAQVAAAQAQPLIEAVARASAAGITFVAAAANSGANNDTTDMYPANVDVANLIAVAASDPNDAKPSWSNYGKAKVHLASPGLDIVSTLPNGAYSKLSGTSMATPLVAGLVALMKSQAKGALTGAQARSLLQSTGAQVAIETACMCRIDAAGALDALASDQLVLVPAAATLPLNATTQVEGFGGSGAGYQFASANPAVVDVAADGTVTAKGVGEATITLKDSAGTEARSLTFRVVDGGGGGGGGSGDCPFDDPMTCELMCQLMPELPWCKR
jgi:thermitase